MKKPLLTFSLMVWLLTLSFVSLKMWKQGKTALALAVANQLGNGGATLLALLLILASVGYAFFVVRKSQA